MTFDDSENLNDSDDRDRDSIIRRVVGNGSPLPVQLEREDSQRKNGNLMNISDHLQNILLLRLFGKLFFLFSHFL